jgi:CubicO group peptidase (beta-lactamase class C family)
MWRFPRTSPGEVNVNSQRILDFLEEIRKKGIDLHSLMVIRHGKVAAEGYWTPYAPEKTYTLFSASKTFTALAVGFVYDEGLIAPERPVLEFFPEVRSEEVCPNMRKVTVHHLLTMNVGFEEDPHDFPFEEPDTDWIRNFFRADVPCEPGSHFTYSTHASYLLSAIVQRVTGRTVWAYLKEKLFGKLGFENEWWEESPQHISVGGWGLMVTTEDFAKLGQFLLQKGMWNGEQLLSRYWVQEMTSRQVDSKNHPVANPQDAADFHAGYGYQTWRCRKEDAYMASGGFGQHVIVLPRQDAVIAMTCGTHQDGYLTAFWEKLFPAFDLVQESAKEQEHILSERLKTLQIPYADGSSHNEKMEQYLDGRRYRLHRNKYGYTAVTFAFPDVAEQSSVEPSVWFEMGEKKFQVKMEYRRWVDGITCIRTEETDTDWNVIYQDISACYAWDQDVLEIRTVFDHTPFYDTLRFVFEEEKVMIQAERNVWHYGETLDRGIYGDYEKGAEK